nr:60S ribosomal protein L34 [Cryptomonas curvata]
MSDLRIQLRRHCPFSGKKNFFKKIRTPGKKLSIIYQKKKTNFVKCTQTKIKLTGIKKHSSFNFMSLSKNKKKVSRIYGGCLSASSLKERIIKAFLVEERKIVKRVLKGQEKK